MMLEMLGFVADDWSYDLPLYCVSGQKLAELVGAFADKKWPQPGPDKPCATLVYQTLMEVCTGYFATNYEERNEQDSDIEILPAAPAPSTTARVGGRALIPAPTPAPASPAREAAPAPAPASPVSVAAPAPAAASPPARAATAQYGFVKPKEEDDSMELLQGDEIVTSYQDAKNFAAIAERLDERKLELVEIVNNRSDVMREMERMGVILPKSGRLGLLTHGGHDGTPRVQKLVCMGCKAHISRGLYKKPTGKHYYVFCWSTKGEDKDPLCIDLMPYYMKKYMLKNFDVLYEQSKRCNAQDRERGTPSGSSAALAARAARAIADRQAARQ